MFKSIGELTEESTNLKTEQQKLFNLKKEGNRRKIRASNTCTLPSNTGAKMRGIEGKEKQKGQKEYLKKQCPKTSCLLKTITLYIQTFNKLQVG